MTRFMAALETMHFKDLLNRVEDDTATAGIQDINQTDFLNGEAVADVDADSNIALTPQSLAKTGVIANV